jgi:Ni,Fe-hydrogenase I cytochrome b subunit
VVEEDNGAVKAVKQAEGVAMTHDSEYHQTIGLQAVTYTLVFTNTYFISTFYFCGTRFLVERIYLWNAFIRVTHLSLCNVFICGTYFFVERTHLVFVERLYLWNAVVKKPPPRRRWRTSI